MKFLSIANCVFLLSLIGFNGGGGAGIAKAEGFSGDRPVELGSPAIVELPEDGAVDSFSFNFSGQGEKSSQFLAADSVNSAELLTGTTAIAIPSSFILPSDRTVPETPADPGENNPVLAQRDGEIRLGRTSRGVGNYVGAAINIGLNDQASPLGRGSFALISKIGLAEQVSLRPSVLFGEHLMLLVPVTIDFPFADTEDTLQVNLAPYIGSGIALSTDTDNPIGFFGTAGIDRVLFDRFTATAALNVGYVEEIEVGIFVGGGYRF